MCAYNQLKYNKLRNSHSVDMLKPIKYLLAFVLALALNHVYAVSSEILPADIEDYTAFFNEYYQLAVDGDMQAQLYVGALYENGLGVKKDLTLSHVYYNLASASGSQDAISQRKKIEKLLSKEEFAEARKLAKLYKQGVGIDHPRQTASLNVKTDSSENLPDPDVKPEKNIIKETSSEQDITATSEEATASSTDVHLNFFNAVINNDFAQIQRLVSSAEVDVNYRFSDDKTALMLASELGNLSTVGTLLDLGANANLKSKDNKTALRIATDSGHEYIAAVLRTKTLVPSKLVKDIQVYLTKLEYRPGPVDGLYGDRTKRSLRKFSSDYKQDFPIEEASQQQLETLKIAYNDYVAKKLNEQQQQEKIQSQAAKKPQDKNENKVVSTTVVTADPVKKPISEEKIAIKKVKLHELKPKKVDPWKKVGIYPDITGTYNAQTVAVFSNCGGYNQTIKYFAEETIKNLKKNGRFNISYKTPLLNCTGKGKFSKNPNHLTGNYDCYYKTTEGFRGTLKMSIDGQIEEEKLIMKYTGKDTSPGITCDYDWERTLTAIQ